MIKVNGKEYPMWSQFVEGKARFIGGRLIDHGDDFPGSDFPESNGIGKTVITDVTLTANGEDSAYLTFHGENFGCSGDVKHLGISGEQSEGITFRGYGGHRFEVIAKK